MFDVHSFKPASFESQPYGGHGYPGRTLDTLSGTGLDVGPRREPSTAQLDERSAQKMRKLLKFAPIALVTILLGLFGTIGAILAL